VKNSTFVTLPSLSAAFALIVMLAGARKVAPSAGEVMETVGGVVVGGITSTATALLVVKPPLLSVAFAVKE
jgi:hypothetical protein